MLKVLAVALLGTIAGIVLMVMVIVLAGTHTGNTSSVGEGPLPITTYSVGGSSSSSSGGSTGGSTGGGNGAKPTGNAANGKTIFTGSAGCSACHAFTAAGSTGTTGPNLDSLSAAAQKAGMPLADFIHQSIVDPNAYIAPGYSQGIMPATFGQSLSSSDINDLVTFLYDNQK
jgi:mono/diheme cytochrome c family protein